MAPAPPPPPAPHPPSNKRRATLIGNHPVCTSVSMDETYEAGEVIGTGSFGIIRKVTRRVDGMVLARKELNYGRMDERDLRQLTEEVNILEQLGSNDNIVRYYERFVDKPNNMLYILMEFCEGGDLSALIQRCRHQKTHISEELVWSYLAQLTLALSDCHSELDKNGERKPIILHRDIKPENVFMDKENQLKLGDFGLSKAMAQAAMTQTYVGTPYYMSPELINGQLYDVKSDIWALGCLIYELCAGHPPFHEARTQPELAVLIREGKIPDLPRPYSPHLGQVVKAMLKQNPKHRPNTAQLKALESVKIQIRILDLRKVSKELRFRDQQATQRESDLVAREQVLLVREQAILAREQAVQVREATLRANAEAVRDAQTRLDRERDRDRMDRERDVAIEKENSRPGSSLPSSSGLGEEVLARVASRPSLVPRRPLVEERRTSNVASLPFPRLNSCSSLMSLDDTPLKERAMAQPASMGLASRRMGSKSMHDLSTLAAMSATGRHHRDATASPSPCPSPVPAVPDSPTRSPTRSSSLAFQGRRSDSAASHRSTQSTSTDDLTTAPPPLPSSASMVKARSQPTSPTKAQPRPSLDATRSAPTVSLKQPDGVHHVPPVPVQRHLVYGDDEVPSPWLKKTEHLARFATPPVAAAAAAAGASLASASTTSASLNEGKQSSTRPAVPPRAARTSFSSGSGKTSLARQIMAHRVEEVGRRLSMARGKSN